MKVLCGGNARRRMEIRELEREFKTSNILGKIGHKKEPKYHCFGKSCCSFGWFCSLQQRL